MGDGFGSAPLPLVAVLMWCGRALGGDEGGEAFEPAHRDVLGVRPLKAEGDSVAELLVAAFDRV